MLIRDDYLKIKSAWNGLITEDFFIGLQKYDDFEINCPVWFNNYATYICPNYPVLPSDLPDGNNFDDTFGCEAAMIPANFSAARQWNPFLYLNAVLCEFGK